MTVFKVIGVAHSDLTVQLPSALQSFIVSFSSLFSYPAATLLLVHSQHSHSVVFGHSMQLFLETT